MTDALLKILSAIAIAAITSWITVQLSRHKFRAERWWDKKVEAYERVIEAFHNSKKFYTENIKAELSGIEISDERKDELRNSSLIARDEILRASDIGAFILSENAVNILTSYESESEKVDDNANSWFEYLDLSWGITNKYMKEFISEAKTNLRK